MKAFLFPQHPGIGKHPPVACIGGPSPAASDCRERMVPVGGGPERTGVSAESGVVPAFFTRAAQGFSLLAEPLSRCGPVAVSDSLIARKVSLHLLDSILLI